MYGGDHLFSQALAVLTAVYPAATLIYNWLNCLRVIIPTFHKKTKQHEKITLKV